MAGWVSPVSKTTDLELQKMLFAEKLSSVSFEMYCCMTDNDVVGVSEP